MLKIYDSLTRQKKDFVPLRGNEVSMYVCGMTVYDLCHLGHARVQIAFDIIHRYLKFKGYQVKYVRNITDIDDKIIDRAATLKISTDVLTQQTIEAMHQDLAALNLLSPTLEPCATQHVQQMQEMIQSLIAQDYAYVGGNGDVFYRVKRFAAYGELSLQQLDKLQVGARVVENQYKEDPLDFVLWKLSKPQEPAWDSPWGKGRPGWHIECSAMAKMFLGETIDIHGGGFDLKFPHHENERAQSEAVTHQKFVNFWMHAGFLTIKDEKMSKSLQNFLTIRDVLAQHSAQVVRFFLGASHYRSEINYTEHGMQQAQANLDSLYLALRGVSVQDIASTERSAAMQKFIEAMDDDFNVAEALAVIFALRNQLNKAKKAGDAQLAASLAYALRELAQILGLLDLEVEQYFHAAAQTDNALTDAEIAQLLKERQEARHNRNWQRADEIREQLQANKIIIEDSGNDATTWRRG